MSKNKFNTWLTNDGIEQIDFYVTSADVIMLERNRMIKIILDIYRYHFRENKNLTLLDIGCGDGILTRRIHENFPENKFFLLDGSSTMLDKAKNNLKGDNFNFVHQTFEDYIASPADELKYDFIYSANAVHHLDFSSKSKLYEKIYHELQFRGLLLNTDPVLPTSERSEQWQFKMWIDWINETLYKNNYKNEIGKYDGLPSRYKYKAENKPSDLFEQLGLLNRIGFRDVDCFYKYGIFALFGGTK